MRDFTVSREFVNRKKLPELFRLLLLSSREALFLKTPAVFSTRGRGCHTQWRRPAFPKRSTVPRWHRLGCWWRNPSLQQGCAAGNHTVLDARKLQCVRPARLCFPDRSDAATALRKHLPFCLLPHQKAVPHLAVTDSWRWHCHSQVSHQFFVPAPHKVHPEIPSCRLRPRTC